MSTSKKSSKHAKKDEGIIDDAMDFVRTTVFAGLGIAFLVEEPIEKLVKRIMKEGKGLTKDVEKFYKDVKKESIEAREDVEKRITDIIDDIIPSSKKKSSGNKKKKKARKVAKKIHTAAVA